MEWFNVNQLTKEMVAARLSELTDPVDAAVEILEKTIIVALKDVDRLKPGHRQTVTAACQGALTALLIKEYDLRGASVKVLQAMGRIANKTNLDPTELSILALHGIADMKRFVSKDTMAAIRDAISTNFMGAGDALQEIMETGSPKGEEKTQPVIPR